MDTARADRAIRTRILLRAIAARRATATMLFALAVLAVAAAAIGPMFLDSADTSVLTSSITSSPPGEADVTILANGGLGARHDLVEAAHAARELAHGLLEAPVLTVDVGVRFIADQNQGFAADVLARTAICAHLRIVAGTCPRAPDEAMVSERSAIAAALHVGARLTVGEPNATATSKLTISGVYLQPASVDDAYWASDDYFVYGTAVGPIAELDPLITTSSTALAMRREATPQLSADLRWRRGATLQGAPALQSALSSIKARLFSRYGLVASSHLASAIAPAQHDDHLMSSVVLAIVLQLVLLALVTLYTLGRSTIVGRRREAEFARRHGFPRSAQIALAIGEPAVLILAALPVGIVLAWGVLALFTRTLFVAGTPVMIPADAIAGACGACGAGILAMGIASAELWRSAPTHDRRARLAGFATDAFALALALAGLLALSTNGSLDGARANPLAALAPGLLALGAGVIGLRLAALAIRVLVDRTEGSARVAWFLALRQIGRRRAVLSQLLPLTTAAAVVVFSVGSFFLAAANRSTVANFEVGTARVVDVTPPAGLDLEAAVRRADPSGRAAMAAAYYTSSSGSLLAVDASRLASVAFWPASLSRAPLAELARELSPPLSAEISFAGDELRLTLGIAPGTPPIGLTVNVFDELDDASEALVIASLRPGVHTYGLSLSGTCPGTCRLMSLSPSWVDPDEPDTRDVRFVLDGLAVRTGSRWRSIALGAEVPGRWTATPSSIRVSAATDAHPGVTFEIPGGELVYAGLLLSPVELPAAIPAIVTTGAESFNRPTPPSGDVALEGLDGGPLTAKPIAVVSSLPFIGDESAMVDLDLAQRAVTNTEIDTTFQVWLSSDASPTILRHLRADGVVIGPTTRAATRLGALDHSGVALAYALALVVSPIAALLAIGVMCFVIVSDGRNRRREIASLSIASVPWPSVRRALLLESGLVLGVALVVGAGIGYATDALAASSLPEFSSGTDGLALSATVPIVPYLCAIGALGVLLGVVVELATRSVLRALRSPRAHWSGE